MKTLFGVPLMGIREEVDTKVLPNGHKEVDNLFKDLKKKHFALFIVSDFEKVDYPAFESILQEEFMKLHKQNIEFCDNNFQEDNFDSKRIKMIINSVYTYGTERIKSIMDDLQNPKNQLGFFKSLIAKILN